MLTPSSYLVKFSRCTTLNGKNILSFLAAVLLSCMGFRKKLFGTLPSLKKYIFVSVKNSINTLTLLEKKFCLQYYYGAWDLEYDFNHTLSSPKKKKTFFLVTILLWFMGYRRPTFRPIHFRPTSFRPKIFVQSISSNPNLI